jgi:hypothetical protein
VLPNGDGDSLFLGIVTSSRKSADNASYPSSRALGREPMAKPLPELLRDHQRALADLSREPYDGPDSPEVRAILIKTCRDAIEQIKRDIEDPD